MKKRDLERYLRTAGCRLIGEGGNHSLWAGPGGDRTVIPRHREIDFWLVRKICRDLKVQIPSGPR